MLLSIFVITQIALDIAIVGYLLTNGRRRKPAASARRAQPRTAPPPWYHDFLATAEDLMVLVEPVLDLAESGGLAPPPAPSAAAAPAAEPRPAESPRDRHRAALSLLRAGTSPEEVARRERLLPGELRLMRNLVTAEAELAGARGR
jgi:hypothetical protein